MRNVLVTGGTTFVSRCVAEYFLHSGDRVYVLNRGSKPQSDGVIHLKGDRNALGDLLNGYYFDVVLDVTAYTGEHINNLLDAIGGFGEYILVSSSAVYPETTSMPFCESDAVGINSIWGDYGKNKIEAEKALMSRVPSAYILRPPYLYGPMQNLYREPFVFDCAIEDRVFVLPKNDKMKLQFFHVEDMCRFMDLILREKPAEHIYNVGNPDTVSIREWVSLCYKVAGKTPEFFKAGSEHPVRSYFCFYDYEYCLDVSKMQKLMPNVKSLENGFREEFEWYQEHKEEILQKPYRQYIDKFIF